MSLQPFENLRPQFAHFLGREAVLASWNGEQRNIIAGGFQSFCQFDALLVWNHVIAIAV